MIRWSVFNMLFQYLLVQSGVYMGTLVLSDQSMLSIAGLLVVESGVNQNLHWPAGIR